MRISRKDIINLFLKMANKIGEYMEEHGINMIRECVPTALEEAGENKIKVKRFLVISTYLVFIVD